MINLVSLEQCYEKFLVFTRVKLSNAPSNLFICASCKINSASNVMDLTKFLTLSPSLSLPPSLSLSIGNLIDRFKNVKKLLSCIDLFSVMKTLTIRMYYRMQLKYPVDGNGSKQQDMKDRTSLLYNFFNFFKSLFYRYNQ